MMGARIAGNIPIINRVIVPQFSVNTVIFHGTPII